MNTKKRKIAQYKQIEKDILDKIQTGYFKQNDMIPTELELSNTYNVSRVTVRRATDNLVAQGLLYRTAGVGTFVNHNPATQKIATLKSFTEEMEALGLKASTKVTSFSIIEADSKIARMIGVEPGDMIYYIERTRYGNDDIFVFEKTFMSVKDNPDISIKVLEGSKYHYIEHVRNKKIKYSYHQTYPVLPPKNIAEIFDLDENTPIIKIGNTTYLEDGSILDYTELYMNSPKYQLNYIRAR
ncbi:GntR family transcriptional regulator [Clostridium paraputrificum]|uniref:GntR family transcriptional regulator n=1 Tax=Clostridium paraputrificum TaxID=29363 RepID=UPI003D34E033